jgi:hypothetical protein
MSRRKRQHQLLAITLPFIPLSLVEPHSIVVNSFSESEKKEDAVMLNSSQMKQLSPGVFGITLLCFFLPFINITCGGEKIASVSARELVTGGTLETPEQSDKGGKGMELKGKIKSEPLAVVLLVFVVAGLVFSFLKKNVFTILAAVSAGAALITQLMLRSKILQDIDKEGEKLLQIEMAFGFWTILLLLIVALAMNMLLVLKKRTT